MQFLLMDMQHILCICYVLLMLLVLKPLGYAFPTDSFEIETKIDEQVELTHRSASNVTLPWLLP